MTTKIKKSNLDADVFGSIGTHLIPDTNVTYDLGSAEKKFRDLYLSSGTIHLGDVKLSTTSGALEILDADGNTLPPADVYNQTDIDAMISTVNTNITSVSNDVTSVSTTLATKRTYFEQAEAPAEAVSGDVWRDTDTGVIAVLYVDGTDRIWMEF